MHESKGEEKRGEDFRSDSDEEHDEKQSTGFEGRDSDVNTEKELIQRAISYCFSHNFLDIFETYIQKNAYIFDDAVDIEEHRLEYTESFKDYLKLYEHTMEAWVENQGTTLEDFHRALKDTDELGTPEEKHFLSLLLASAEYDCYYNVMVTEARKQRSSVESKN